MKTGRKIYSEKIYLGGKPFDKWIFLAISDLICIIVIKKSSLVFETFVLGKKLQQRTMFMH